jgi:hypothetical protein
MLNIGEMIIYIQNIGRKIGRKYFSLNSEAQKRGETEREKERQEREERREEERREKERRRKEEIRV